MKIPKSLGRTVAEDDPILEIVACSKPIAEATNILNVVRINHAQFSQTAKRLRLAFGGGERGILSIESGAGSSPGADDATFLTLSQLKSLATTGQTEAELSETLVEAVQTYDSKNEFLLTLIAEGHSITVRVRNGKEIGVTGSEDMSDLSYVATREARA